MRSHLTAICALAITLSLSACAQVELSRPDATEYKRTVTHAIPQDTSTSLGKAISFGMRQHHGLSGFRVLNTGSESLEMRLALVQAAEKTIDLQYFTMHDDVTANLLLESILRAASRGVRVRFLLDSMSLGEVGESLSVLDGNKNIEIRVFNPLATRDQFIGARVTGLVKDIGQYNKRMHNKAFVSDNQLSIIGGRNLGDEYFDANKDVNFKDLDILAAGPVTAEISKNFDRYWNSEDSFPLAAVEMPKTNPKHLEKLKHELRENWIKQEKTADGQKMLHSTLAQRLKKSEISFTWTRAEVVADEPTKVKQEEHAVVSKPLQSIARLANDAKHEFIIVSPYFVPQVDGVNWLGALVKRGIDVKVLTNSLSSTDVVAVQSGYEDYRKDLLDSGVALYEAKNITGKKKQRLFALSTPPHASLHAKVYIIDRKDVVIGSFNFDPRSIALNTESAIVIHSEKIAAELVDMFQQSIAPEVSYRLHHTKNDSLVWITKKDGQMVQYNGEPEVGIWRRTQSFLMSLLPLEEHL